MEEIESHPETVSVRNDPASSRRSQTQQEAPVEDKPLSSAPQEYVKSQDDEVPTPYKEEIEESQKDAQNVETPILAELIVDSGERGILDQLEGAESDYELDFSEPRYTRAALVIQR